MSTVEFFWIDAVGLLMLATGLGFCLGAIFMVLIIDFDFEFLTKYVNEWSRRRELERRLESLTRSDMEDPYRETEVG